VTRTLRKIVASFLGDAQLSIGKISPQLGHLRQHDRRIVT
jgi:hypothetical protein